MNKPNKWTDPVDRRSEMTVYKWTEVYKAALLETDWTKMEERLKVVEDALDERKREFALDHGGSPEENEAIENAIRGLRVLRREVEAWRSVA